MKSPTIIVVAYNRPQSLHRLLTSLQAAHMDGHKPDLVFCIDYHKSQTVLKMADDFKWPHGNKEIIHQSSHLGLREHMLSVIKLSRKFNDIIVLEDDLVVSPFFYQYAVDAFSYYGKDARIAGLSLYVYGISESSLLSFMPVDNGSDVYFVQFPSSWGFCINKEQYDRFAKSHEKGGLDNAKYDPAFVSQWSAHSWKKLFIRYMLKHDKLFVYPRLSLTANFADKGRNTPRKMSLFQVPLQMQARQYVFADSADNISTYDVYFEIVPEAFKKLCPLLKHYTFEMDLQGVKDLRHVKLLYTLTTKKTKKQIMAFDAAMNPLIQNMAYGIKGNDISFTLTSNLYSLKPMRQHFGHAEYLARYAKLLPGAAKSITYFFYLWRFYCLMVIKRITASI